MNDDMYVCPRWDLHLWEMIEQMPNHYFYLSATMIEPVSTGNKCVLAPYNFGTSIETFRENELLAQCETLNFRNWNGACWPPSLMHRDVWQLIGGFSVEFSPGMASDPDMAMKLWTIGVRTFVGCAKSRVYHFMCKSTGKVVKNDGRTQFLMKWGMSISTFYKHYLHIGSEYNGELQMPQLTGSLRITKIKDRFKRIKKSLVL